MALNDLPVSPFNNIYPPDLFPNFVGRRQELENINHAFGTGLRGVLIFGSAGVGKTSLARIFASNYKYEFPGGAAHTYASQFENPVDVVTRVFNKPPIQSALLVIDEAHLLGESSRAQLLDILNRYPKLKIILISQLKLELPDGFITIHLTGFDRNEFRELHQLRNAIAHGEINNQTVQRLFDLTGGNPAIAVIASEAVTSGIVDSWSDLFTYLRNFDTAGLIGVNGLPLNQQSPEYRQVIVSASSANDEIMRILKKDPTVVWKLPPRKFEEIVAEILNKQGFQVELTPASGDGGVDIYAARKDGLGQFLYLVECKRYVPPSKVGVEIVRSLYGVLQVQKATAGAIVTTSYFTKGAEAFQREIQHQMYLHNYIALQKWISDFPLRK
jgi:restriction system protein